MLLGQWVDQRDSRKVFKRNSIVQQPKFIGILGRKTRQEDFPTVVDLARADLVNMARKIGCAIVGDRIIKLRVIGKPIHSLDHINKQRLGLQRIGDRWINVDVGTVMFGSQANHIPFIAEDISQFILPGQTKNWAVIFAQLLTDFNRDGKVTAVIESKAEYRVGQFGRVYERRDNKINRLDLIKLNLPIVVGNDIIVLGQVAVVADVCEGVLLSIDLSSWSSGQFRFPITIIGRSKSLLHTLGDI